MVSFPGHGCLESSLFMRKDEVSSHLQSYEINSFTEGQWHRFQDLFPFVKGQRMSRIKFFLLHDNLLY